MTPFPRGSNAPQVVCRQGMKPVLSALLPFRFSELVYHCYRLCIPSEKAFPLLHAIHGSARQSFNVTRVVPAEVYYRTPLTCAKNTEK